MIVALVLIFHQNNTWNRVIYLEMVTYPNARVSELPVIIVSVNHKIPLVRRGKGKSKGFGVDRVTGVAGTLIMTCC